MKIKTILSLAVAAAVVVGAETSLAGNGGFELGVGANYWYSLDDAIDSDHEFDEDGLGWMISSRWMWTDYLGLGFEFERSPDNYVALDDYVYAPSAHLILGGGLYLGLGIGYNYYDGDFYEDPFYNVRAGIKTRFVSPFIIDINLNYRTMSFDDARDVFNHSLDTDTLTLGAAVRIDF